MPPNQYRASVKHAVIQNLETLEVMRFLLNPEQLSTTLQVNWARRSPLMGTRQRLQFKGTNNISINLSLVFDRMVYFDDARSATGGTLTANRIATLKDKFETDYRRFLLAFCYPVGDPSDPLRRSPPAGMLVYPGYLAMKFVLLSVQFQDVRFDQDLRPVTTRASLSIEEYRTYRLNSSDARKAGFLQYKGLNF